MVKAANAIPRAVLQPNFVAGFWAKTLPVGDCIEWQLSLDNHGYGRTRAPRSRTIFRTHRVAWFISKGKDPGHKWVLHKCDNPKCCNPAHLFLGDDASNALDKVRKGRAYTGEHGGDRNPNAILTNDQAAEVARCLMAGMGTGEIILRIGAGNMAIVSAIRRGKAWREASASVGYAPPHQKSLGGLVGGLEKPAKTTQLKTKENINGNGAPTRNQSDKSRP